MAKISALKMVPTAKLPEFQLKATDILHCFLTEGSANAFAMSQLHLADEQKLRSWGVEHPAHPDRQIGIGMSFVRYDITLPDSMVQKMIRSQHDSSRPTNYVGTVQPNGVNFPVPSAYFVGKDDAGKLQKLPAETDIAALVQERKNICEKKRDEVVNRLVQKAENAEATNTAKMSKIKDRIAKSIEESKSDPTENTPGSCLITQHRSLLSEKAGYTSFIRNLESSYKAKSLRDHNDPSGMKAAHQAIVDVYSQIQRFAVKRDDFEMATFAHNTVEAANGYLISLEHDSKYGEEYQNGISREELDDMGIHVPERDEW